MHDALPVVDLAHELRTLHEATFAWALACCGRDRATAEDVLQDAYFKVLEGRARFEGRSTFKTWLFGVVRMTARSHRRFAFLRSATGAEGEETADSRRGPESDLATRQRAERLAAALGRLSERQREVMHLVFYEDLTVAEAAEVMGVSVGSARQHYDRGKHALAATLGEAR